jgi:Ca2+/H+ antiporter
MPSLQVSAIRPPFFIHPSRLFALLIAWGPPTTTELLVDVVDVVLTGSGIDEKFLGITLFALVPNTTEFMNAVSFAMNGNIALGYVTTSLYQLLPEIFCFLFGAW